MNQESLLIEGDVNFSPSRQAWYEVADSATLELLKKDEDLFMHQSLSTPCLDVIAAAEGIYLTDTLGKRYMDFHGNNVHQIRHRNPFVIERVKQQMDTLPFCPRRFTNTTAIDFAGKLVSLLPQALNRVLFAPGGTSVVGMALKLARVVTGRHRVVSLSDSFHGASMDAIAVGGENQFKKYMGTLVPETKNIPQPVHYRSVFTPQADDTSYADELEKILQQDSQVGAFIAETIRNTDVQIPSRGFWQRVREICDRYGVLLILDEIPIAFGRTGTMFAFEHYGISPDILCLGKGLGGGIIPFAAMVTKDSYNIAGDVSLGHYTHEKSPLGCAAGLALIEYLQSHKLLEKVQADSAFMAEALGELKNKYRLIGDVRGIGLLWGIELVRDRSTKVKAIEEAGRIMYSCLKNGLSFKVSQGNVLQLSPPLTITREELQKALSVLDTALAAETAVIAP